jgi:hypothetical protein
MTDAGLGGKGDVIVSSPCNWPALSSQCRRRPGSIACNVCAKKYPPAQIRRALTLGLPSHLAPGIVANDAIDSQPF